MSEDDNVVPFSSVPRMPEKEKFAKNVTLKGTPKGYCMYCGNEGFVILKNGDAAPCRFCEIGEKKTDAWIKRGEHVPHYPFSDLDPDAFATPPWAPAASPEQAKASIDSMRAAFAAFDARASGFRGNDPLGPLGQETVRRAKAFDVEADAVEIGDDVVGDFVGPEPPPP